MRIVREIPHSSVKITIYAWNNRYLIKFEKGPLEQTFKVHETDVAGEEDVINIIDAEFLQHALNGFNSMGQALYEAMQRNSL